MHGGLFGAMRIHQEPSVSIGAFVSSGNSKRILEDPRECKHENRSRSKRFMEIYLILQDSIKNHQYLEDVRVRVRV